MSTITVHLYRDTFLVVGEIEAVNRVPDANDPLPHAMAQAWDVEHVDASRRRPTAGSTFWERRHEMAARYLVVELVAGEGPEQVCPGRDCANAGQEVIDAIAHRLSIQC